METQTYLFKEEDAKEEALSHIIKAILNQGKSHKFIEVHIRSYKLSTGTNLSGVLKALRDVELRSKGICIAINEISSQKPLKKRNSNSIESMDKYFRSSISEDQIVIDSSVSKIEYLVKSLFKSYSNIFRSFARVSTKHLSVDDSDKVRLKFLELLKAEESLLNEIKSIYAV